MPKRRTSLSCIKRGECSRNKMQMQLPAATDSGPRPPGQKTTFGVLCCLCRKKANGCSARTKLVRIQRHLVMKKESIYQLLHEIVRMVLAMQLISFARQLSLFWAGTFSRKRQLGKVSCWTYKVISMCLAKIFVRVIQCHLKFTCPCLWLQRLGYVHPWHVVFWHESLVRAWLVLFQCLAPLVFDSGATDFSVLPELWYASSWADPTNMKILHIIRNL